MLTKTLRGPEEVKAYHQLMNGIQGTREYLARFTPTGGLAEYWNSVIDGHLLQGIDVFQFDDSGRVTDQTVWLRPWPPCCATGPSPPAFLSSPRTTGAFPPGPAICRSSAAGITPRTL
jgi:hypothetical protein